MVRRKPALAQSSSIGAEQARVRIRAVGLRVTPGRVESYRALYAAGGPLTHGDVVERLAHLGLDRATVYRNLTDLTEAGLVVRSDHGDHVWRFELPHEHAQAHAHFVCVDCGDVACLEDVAVDIRPGGASPKAVQDDQVEVQLRGRCDACA